MGLIENLLSVVPDGRVVEIRIGLHWTAAVVEVDGKRQCGLASTVTEEHQHGREPDIPDAGHLLDIPARELAQYALSERMPKSSVGMAVLNALLPDPPDNQLVDINAEDVIARYGAGKSVALIGSFPFIPRIQDKVGKLTILERNPHDGEVPAEMASEVLPQADVVAITSMTLVNHSFEEVFGLCSPEAVKLMLGPTTPMHQASFDYGVSLLSGSVITDPDAVLRCLEQGANFRQIHHAGVRLVTMTSPALKQADGIN
ncbi:MAG: DUF364 domain-containing protein [Anaerolineaceae bacterium]|jgi:uncharacterized protein (DUF4213/DUF364 family)|nr:DUF364 domain-containing protein [Anaerolineaceae bacterium]